MGNAARVCDMHCKLALDISSKKKSRGEIAASISDKLLHDAAMHEGYLTQANRLLSTGVNVDKLMELEGAFCEVEHENGSTYRSL